MNNSVAATEILQALLDVDFLQMGLIVAGTWLLIVGSSRALSWLAAKIDGHYRYYLLSAIPVFRLLIILSALLLFISSIIEPTVENLMVLLGALGLALGFAFKDYVSSLLAGVVILYEAPFRPGDWVEINGAYGEVRSINMRSTEIITPDDTVVVIPHLKVWNELVFNANDGSRNLQCAADFYLHPCHNGDQVRQILYDVALTSPFLQLEQPVRVIVKERPWATHYRLKAYPIDPGEQFHFVSDLTIRGKDALQGIGVEYSRTPPSVSGEEKA